MSVPIEETHASRNGVPTDPALAQQFPHLVNERKQGSAFSSSLGRKYTDCRPQFWPLRRQFYIPVFSGWLGCNRAGTMVAQCKCQMLIANRARKENA
jgi:hypothetical protein